MARLVLLWLSAAPLCCLSSLAARTVYQPDWPSLDRRGTPDWWSEQKFSLFMHWGLYSVPAFCPATPEMHTCYAEHFFDQVLPWSHNPDTPEQAYLNRTFGAGFEYPDFAPMFKASLFNATAWAELFEASGAQGLTMTSKHHEGWTLWPNSRHADWNSVDTGPHRDLLREVRDAVRARGLRWGVYYSLLQWNRQWDPRMGCDEACQQRYVREVMIPDLKELASEYLPDVIYVDGEWDRDSDFWQTKPFLGAQCKGSGSRWAAWLFNESPVRDSVAVNDRWGNETRGKHGGFFVCEYSGETDGSCITDNPTHAWTSHEGMGKSFGYNKLDIYNTSSYFVKLLVQSAANGGHLQLNVGPDCDGRIPDPQPQILRDIGSWLALNRQAIYNSSGFALGVKAGGCSSTIGNGTEVCLTRAGTTVFAIAIGWPSSLVFKTALLRPTASARVSILGVPAYQDLKLVSSGVETHVEVPVVPIVELPSIDVKVEAFVFIIRGLENGILVA